jgi:hypothetical protein
MALRVGLTEDEADKISVYMKARNRRGLDLPIIFQQHLIAQRLGLKSWDQVEEMPHLQLILELDLMRIDDEVQAWRKQHPGY